MTEILLCLYKQFISYDRAKTEKIGNFFALTWLIFAAPVTNVTEYWVVDSNCTFAIIYGAAHAKFTITLMFSYMPQIKLLCYT